MPIRLLFSHLWAVATGVLILFASNAGCSRKSVPSDSTTTGEPNLQVAASNDLREKTEVLSRDEKTASSFRFREIGNESGFDFERYDDMRGQRRILEVNGGGVAVFDFDHDGWLDVFMSNGCRLPLSQDTRETPGKLFRNLKAMKFLDCSEASMLQQFGYCYGCAAADANEDGFEDLYLTAYGGNQFWVNNGDGSFSEVSADNGTLTGVWGSSAAFADLNGDQCLDLYVVNYLDESDENPHLCPEPASPDGYAGCSPAIFSGVSDTLFLSDGAGGYVNASKEAGLAELPGKGLGLVIGDLGGDSRPEIYVANDGEPNFLLTIEPAALIAGRINGIRLHDVATSANAALNEHGYAQASMGVAAADFDRNGAMDVFLTHFYGDTNTLYLNRSTGNSLLFEDATRLSRLGPPSRSVLGFGVASIDIDNNGWTDLIVANGHVDDRTWVKASQPYRMLPQVFENIQDGTFREVSEGAGSYFTEPTLGRGLAIGDLDRDGRMDAVVSHQLAPSVILRNETECRNSVTLRLIGSSMRSPIGAKVQIINSEQSLTEQIVGGGSFQSASANEVCLGTVSQTSTKIRIDWVKGDSAVIEISSNGVWCIDQKLGLNRLEL